MILGTGTLDQRLDHVYERPPGFAWWTIGAMLHGSVLTESRGRSTVTRARCLSIIRPRTPYRVCFGGEGQRWSETWVIFAPRPDWLPMLDWPEVLPGISTLAADQGPAAEAFALVAQTHQFAIGSLPERMRFAENTLERAILHAHLANPRAAHHDKHPAVRAAIEAIETRWQEALDVHALARIAGCSRSHFAHLFADQVGTTPKAYLEAHRIERAKHLLVATTLAVKEVAAAVGFPNPFHFSTRFRHHLGCSPLAYRRKPE
ncbi:MAG: helix-turn-helix domain-containing protein [Planctomycetes bacterium]|nr:helix-turn-helix domain-containing protein [Planctomycetota bacterium]